MSRILAGSVRIRAGEKLFFVKTPSATHKYAANELYARQLERGLSRGLFTDSELLAHLYEHKLWDDSRESLLNNLPGEIEQFKVGLFESAFKSREKEIIRKSLAIAKAKLVEVETERHAYDHLAASGAAALAKSRFLLAMSLWRRGKRVFTPSAYWAYRGSLLEKTVAALAKVRVNEADYRELARTEPWASVWRAKKASASVFGVSASELSDEQRTLVSMTMLYDFVYKHPERPADDVIEDDDVLDGWLILQRRGKSTAGSGKLALSDKIAACGEVFIPADTAADAAKVMELNDGHGKAILKQRFDLLRKEGRVNELDMPDTKQRLREEVTARLSAMLKQ